MRLLMTTDAVGGVWQYSLTLARGLVEREGCRVMLVCMGDPCREDFAEIAPVDGLELVALPLKLEWMPDAAADVARGIEQVGRLVDLWKPDLIHSNQFCFGLLDTRAPRVVVAHSDVLSWHRWHREESCCHAERGDGNGDAETRRVGPLPGPPLDPDLRAYRELVVGGLDGASAVVCPSHFMARSLREIYGRDSRVIHNGLWSHLYPSRPKRSVALVAGRLWDEAKGAATAVEAVEGLPLELHLLGPTLGPSGEATYLPSTPNVRYLGSRSWREARDAMAEACLYLATSSYEPFGLAALEAAFCGCALVAAGTPAYREVWGPAAIYFRPRDAADLRRQLGRLIQDPGEVERMGKAARARALERYTAERMAAEYVQLYRSLIQPAGEPSSLRPLAYDT